MGVKRKKTPRSLTHGRPPTIKRSNLSFSRRAAKALINKRHTLEKRRQQALSVGDEAAAAAISAEISALGGLDLYQQASLLGQSKTRGGDSSKILLEWLRPFIVSRNKRKGSLQIRMLEVGALSTSNACAASGYFDTVRIDLNSQAPEIQKQDFMERPLPVYDNDRFDIISLSLVLNFVPDTAGRGRMLQRTTAFLREPPNTLKSDPGLFPSIFIVLPRSCILNSRYCSEKLFEEIMTSIGYSQVKSKITEKLIYTLWRRDKLGSASTQIFPKKEINPGPKRNNFAIVLKSQDVPGSSTV